MPHRELTYSIRKEAISGIVVFLVALPLCLGIALASNAPLFAGIIAGVIGGLVVAPLSGSALSVSGPAAGLAVIVADAIKDLDSWNAFTCAVLIAGLIQILFSLFKLGRIGEFFPTSVIKGMLAAIGIIIILKQIPIALGDTGDFKEELSMLKYFAGESAVTEIIEALSNMTFAAILITGFSILTLVYWDSFAKKVGGVFSYFPAALIAVIGSVILQQLFYLLSPAFALVPGSKSFVNLPVADSIYEFTQFFTLPDPANFLTIDVYTTAFVIAIIASIESLLSVEATDKIDPYKRISDTNKELLAQGVGNTCSGLLGGLPLTAVIVRSSANVYTGAKTRYSAFFHGLWLFLAVSLLPHTLNMIPLASLAAILIVIGYKLASPNLFREMYKNRSQFIPFIVTILSVLFTDLLIGVLIGLGVGLYYVIKANHHASMTIVRDDENYLIRFNKDMSFIHKAEVKEALLNIPAGANVIIDGGKASHIDFDILDVLEDFKESCGLNDIKLEFKHMIKPGIHTGGAKREIS